MDLTFGWVELDIRIAVQFQVGFFFQTLVNSAIIEIQLKLQHIYLILAPIANNSKQLMQFEIPMNQISEKL